MAAKAKYIITPDEKIVVFSDMFNHSDFKPMNPISAGFISIWTDEEGRVQCNCFGRSVTLKLGARPQIDSDLAKRQFTNF